MFYEQNQILNVLNCAKCSKEFDEPRLLPCGNTVCNDCISALTIYSNPNTNMFDCAMCFDEHMRPAKGFPIVNSLLKLIEQKPHKVYRGKVVETFQLNLDAIHNKKEQLKSDLNNGEDTIKQHCMNLRCEVHASAEKIILEINELTDCMIADINHYEKKCISRFQTSTGDTQKQFFDQTIDKIRNGVHTYAIYNSTKN